MMVDFRRSRTRELGVVLVLALLVVDGVLVVMALRNQPEPPTVTVMDPPPVTPTGSPTPSPMTTSATPAPTTTTPTPTPTGDPVDLGTPRERPLSVLDEQTAVRGTPGSCAEGGGSVEITQDGGASWNGLGIPELAVVRVRITDDDLFFIGADTDCGTDLVRDQERDENWTSSGSTNNAWHLLGEPDSPQIHAPPDNLLLAPCEAFGASIVELEGLDDVTAYILCGDGSVHLTGDAADSWGLVGNAPGARAMGLAEGEPLVVATNVEGCDGLAVQRIDESGSALVGCAEGAEDAGVALAFAGQVGFLLAGSDTWTTLNGGETWDQVGAA
jgi:hypothetical protein